MPDPPLSAHLSLAVVPHHAQRLVLCDLHQVCGVGGVTQAGGVQGRLHVWRHSSDTRRCLIPLLTQPPDSAAAISCHLHDM
jgi:hypothetical protein